MIYYFKFNSIHTHFKNRYREYSINPMECTMVRVKIGPDAYMCFYFDEWDDWNVV